MLRDQLNQLSKTQQIHEIKPKDTITFINSDYIDTETLFEMNNLVTHYAANKYKYFDRYKFTMQKELKFNIKFKQYIKDLLTHRKHESFMYVLEIMVRIFHVDVFNTEELLFIILPSVEFQEQTLVLSRKVEFLGNYVKHDHRNFAIQMLKNIYLFDFFIGYFDYFQDVSEFIEEVVNELCYLNGYVKCIDRIYTLLNELYESHCIDLFIKLYDSVQKECELTEDFINLRKKVENIQGKHIHKTEEDLIANTIIKRQKIEDQEAKNFDVRKIIDDLQQQYDIDLNIIKKYLECISDRGLLLKYVASRIDKEKLSNLFQIIDASDACFLNEFVTIENINTYIETHGDTIIKYLSRDFVSKNISVIFETTIEKSSSNFEGIIDFLSEEVIYNYAYDTEISRLNLIKLFKVKDMNYYRFIKSKNLFDINTCIFLLSNECDLGSNELLDIFSTIKEIDDDYLSKLFLIKILDVQIEGVLLEDVLNFFIMKSEFNEYIVKLLISYYDKYEFIKALARNYIGGKSFKELAPLIYKVAIVETDYTCDVLYHDSNHLLTELLRLLPLTKVINDDNSLFINNFEKIQDSLRTLSINLKDEISDTDILQSNFRDFVGLSLENSEVLIDKFVDLFTDNEIFYINLFYFPNNGIYMVLIVEGLKKHGSSYNKIYEIISSDIYKFLDIYFDIYLELKNMLMINENKIIENLKNEIDDEKIIKNINILIADLLNKDNLNINNLEILVRYSDETNIMVLIKKFTNLLVPYLDSIISRFSKNENVFSGLDQIDSIEILKALDKLYSSTNNQQYLYLMSNFFGRIPKTDQKMIVKYFTFNINKYYEFTDLVSNFLVFASLAKIEQVKIQKLLDFYDDDKLYEIFSYYLQFDNLYFNDYIEYYLNDILAHKFNRINCVTLFFKKEITIQLPETLITEATSILFNEYLKNNDQLLLECLSILLDNSSSHTQMFEINASILKNIKNDESIELFTLLNYLYQNVKKYVECISKSVQYFSIFLDHKNREIQKSTKKLFADILNYTGKNVYDYFD